MTSHTANSQDLMPVRSNSEQWENPDEIDVSIYLNILRRRWRQIGLIAVATVAVTAITILFIRLALPPIYEETATAAIVRTLTTVQFDERFTTTSGESEITADTRRAALVALATSGAIAQQVIEQLGDELPAELRNPSQLLESVEAEMATTGRSGQSDLVNISVRANSPELAADIANAWVKTYVQQVNSVYGQVPDDMLSSVEAQLIEAQATYIAAQTKLEQYISTSQLDSLTRQSEATLNTLKSLQQGKIDALDSYMASLVAAYSDIVKSYVGAQTDAQLLAFRKEQEGESARMTAYFDAYNVAQVETFTGQSNRLRSQLNMEYEQWLRTSSLLNAARTLQQQVADGETSAAGSELAIQVLNLQMVNGAADAQSEQKTPLQIQLDTANSTTLPTSAVDVRSQIDATVASLERQLEDLDQSIEQLSQSLLSGNSFQALNQTVPADSALSNAISQAYPALFQSGVFSAASLQTDPNALLTAGMDQATRLLEQSENSTLPTADSPDAPMHDSIVQLEEKLRLLQGQIEVENARKLQFTQDRDIAWQSVSALRNKHAELQLARAAANSEVRLSSLAVPLDVPVEQVSLLFSLAIAAVVGLVLGIITAFVLNAVDADKQQLAAEGAAS